MYFYAIFARVKHYYWHELISAWMNKKKEGLTIPFIIGAHQLLFPNQEEESVTSLLISIRDSSISEIVVLKRCDDIDDYILTIEKYPKFLTLNLIPNNSQEKWLSSNKYSKSVTFVDI